MKYLRSNESWIKYLDYFFITRPILFLPGWATTIAGYLAAIESLNLIDLLIKGNFRIEFWDARLFWGIVVFSFAMGGSFILNQLRDVSTDKKNNKLFLLGDGHVPIRHGYAESFLLLVVSLIIGIKMKFTLFLVITIGLAVGAYMYNFSPFNFKNKPNWGLISNMVIGWLAFVIGWILLEPINSTLIIRSLPYLFFNTGLYFLTTLPDMEGDALSHKITFPVKYGFKTTVWMSIICFLITIFLSLILRDQFLFVTVVLICPFMMRLILSRNVASAILVVKMGIFFFCIVLSIKFPLFLLILIYLFLLSRFYYKRRFQFDYPNFKGA